MNVYDFDGTIYDGDSSIDFFKFCVKKNRKCLLILPSFFLSVVLYFLKIKEKEYMKTSFFRFMKYFENKEKLVNLFWKEHEHKIKAWYLKKRKSNDLVISASPEFLILPMSRKYGFKLLASVVNIDSGEFLSKNCYGEEKVSRLAEMGVDTIDNFYSDSLSDLPLKLLSNRAYIVKSDKIIEWDNYRESFIKKMFKIFFSPDFIVFCFIGLINVFNGVFFAYIYSSMFNDILAYIFGFVTSLLISYMLNSILNFKEKLSLNKLLKFSLSNVPNFLIQIFSVVVLLDILMYPKIVSYFVSAVVAVPITFLLVKFKVFKK